MSTKRILQSLFRATVKEDGLESFVKEMDEFASEKIRRLFTRHFIGMKKTFNYANIPGLCPSQTDLVDKLMALGYVEKSRDTTDQRITLVKLTEKGKTLRPDLEDISQKLLAKVYKGISEGEKQILIETLTKIKNNF